MDVECLERNVLGDWGAEGTRFGGGRECCFGAQFVQEFGLNESGDIDGPGEVGEARSFWNDS
jgi:hypothetical protein